MLLLSTRSDIVEGAENSVLTVTVVVIPIVGIIVKVFEFLFLSLILSSFLGGFGFGAGFGASTSLGPCVEVEVSSWTGFASCSWTADRVAGGSTVNCNL